MHAKKIVALLSIFFLMISSMWSSASASFWNWSMTGGAGGEGGVPVAYGGYVGANDQVCYLVDPSDPGNLVDQLCKGGIDDLLNKILEMIFGFSIRNLNDTTRFITNLNAEGFKNSTRTIIRSYLMPGVFNINFCMPQRFNYDKLRFDYFEETYSGKIGPSSNTNYFAAAINATGYGNAPAISYPPPRRGDFLSSDDNADSYVKHVAQATVLMAGPGTGLSSITTDKNSEMYRAFQSLPEHERLKIQGDMRRIEALSQANVNLAVTGAEMSVNARKVMEELEKNNPESWKDMLFSQVLKDVGKLLYQQNQLLAKLLDIQGQMAIQISAMAQMQTSEYANRLYGEWLRNTPVTAGSGK